jgi:hypothetical protein
LLCGDAEKGLAVELITRQHGQPAGGQRPHGDVLPALGRAQRRVEDGSGPASTAGCWSISITGNPSSSTCASSSAIGWSLSIAPAGRLCWR